MKNALRYKLLEWFLLFAFLIVLIVVPVHLYLQKQQQQFGDIKDQVYQLNIVLLNDLKSTSHFLSQETDNDIFYISGESRFLTRHKQYTSRADSMFANIRNEKLYSKYGVDHELNILQDQWNTHRQKFDSIVGLTFKKGYHQTGLEGKLQEYLTILENNERIPASDIRRLRTALNNYLRHPRETYAENLHIICRNLTNQYKPYQDNKAQEAVFILQKYQSTCSQMIEWDKTLGTAGYKGLTDDIIVLSDRINKQLHKIDRHTEQVYQSGINGLNTFYFILIGITIMLSFLISFLLSKKLSQPLQALTHYIQELAKNNFHYPADKDLQKNSSEINLIYKEFRNLITQLYIRDNQITVAKKRSQENEDKYRELAEMLPQCIFETDYLGNYTFVNKEWHQTFGYTVKDLNEGLNLIETLISEKGEHIMDDVPLENSDFTAVRKDQTQFPASVYTNNIVKEGKVIGKRGIIIDVTEKYRIIRELKQERNKALNADQLKSYFLANMSHEIRTPMNSIIGFSDLLNSPELSDNQKNDFIDHIKSSGELLLTLIDDIIDIAKIEAGEIKIVKRDCNLNKLFLELNDTFTDYKRRENKEHLKIELSIPEEEYVVQTDPFRLKQILQNLISNAIKFTHEGKVTFGFHIASDKSSVIFTVKDTGVGLTRDKLDFIFQRFKQLETYGKNYKGAGLGLAITKNLVELLGGTLHVDSEPDAGTNFSFTHPFILLQKIQPTEPEVTQQENIYDWVNQTFLIAEDDNRNYFFLQEALKVTGANIIRATDGEQAVRLALKNPVDLVLMDIKLPNMDGYKATEAIKNKKPKLPVIAQTAHAMSNVKEQSIMAGCDDYLSKPIRLNLLLPKIAQFIVDKKDKQTTEKKKPSKTTPSSIKKQQ